MNDYAQMIDLNGTGQNMLLRRLSDIELAKLRAEAEKQPALSFSVRHEIAWKAEREQTRRGK